MARAIRQRLIVLSTGVALIVAASTVDASGLWNEPQVSAGSILPRTTAIELTRPGDRVVCLFDSTEGSTSEHNPLSGRVETILADMGIEIVWHDVAKGLPSAQVTGGSRAIVSGFLDSDMDGASRYAVFVEEAVSRGIRVVVIGNYGAYREQSTSEYLDRNTVNRAFGALGVRYQADWTDDPQQFTIKVNADLRTTDDGNIDPALVKHFFQLTPSRDDVRVLVEARRTDDEGGIGRASAAVFASSTGALSLNRYLSPSAMLEDTAEFFVDIEAFLRHALALRPTDPSMLMILFDPESSDSRRVMTSLSTVSSYTGIPMTGVSIKDAGKLRPMDLEGYAGVVLACGEAQSPIDSYLAGLLRSHVMDGGRALAALPVHNDALSSVFWNSGVSREWKKAKGIKFHKGGYPGLDGIEIRGDEVFFSAIEGRPGAGCHVIAESVKVPDGPSVPLWWRCRSGRGFISSLNAFEFADRAFLGFMVQSILDLEGAWSMPVLAAAVEFVDDCPLPMTGRILDRMGKKDTEFYLDDFYGTVVQACVDFGIKPTFLAVFSYDDLVSPPFPEPYQGKIGQASRDLASRIMSDDLSVGLHGLNHMSLAVSGGVSKPFPDRKAIRASLRKARTTFQDVFGHESLPVVYVPPNNFLDLEGKAALAAEVPEIRIIASVFSGSEEELLQDFARDAELPGITSFPRTYAGYLLEGEPLLGLLNGMMTLSVSSHFIHPDDVLDSERSAGRSWKRLRSDFLNGLKDVRKRFPFLRDLSVVAAARELNGILSTGIKVTTDRGRSVRVVRSAGTDFPTTLLVRLPVGCSAKVSSGGRVVHSDPDSGRYHVRMDKRVLSIGCEEG